MTPGRRRRSPAPNPPAAGSAAHDPEPDPESVARVIALRLLTAAPRSRHQLAAALTARNVPNDVAGRLLDRFAEVGLINDAEYARMVVQSGTGRGLARRAIAVDLRRRGIAEDLAGAALEVVDQDAEEANARGLLRRRWRNDVPWEIQARRALAMLGRKGYGSGLSRRLVAEMRDDVPWRTSAEDQMA